MNFFENCDTLSSLKTRFRELSKIHHPDKGGNEKIMQEINAQYSFRKKITEKEFDASKSHFDPSSEQVEPSVSQWKKQHYSDPYFSSDSDPYFSSARQRGKTAYMATELKKRLEELQVKYTNLATQYNEMYTINISVINTNRNLIKDHANEIKNLEEKCEELRKAKNTSVIRLAIFYCLFYLIGKLL